MKSEAEKLIREDLPTDEEIATPIPEVVHNPMPERAALATLLFIFVALPLLWYLTGWQSPLIIAVVLLLGALVYTTAMNLLGLFRVYVATKKGKDSQG